MGTPTSRCAARLGRSYDFHFVLADAALGFQKADEHTVAQIIQMKSLLQEHAEACRDALLYTLYAIVRYIDTMRYTVYAIVLCIYIYTFTDQYICVHYIST